MTPARGGAARQRGVPSHSLWPVSEHPHPKLPGKPGRSPGRTERIWGLPAEERVPGARGTCP